MAKDPICNMEVDEQTSDLSMQAKRTIFAQKNVKNNLNSGQNRSRVSRE